MRAVEAILRHGNVVAPVDVLVGMGILAAEDLEGWRRGRVTYLERVIDCNLTRLSRLLRILRLHAHDLNLVPSMTVYRRWGKGPKQRLRFSKTGDPKIEEAYATSFMWPGKKPFQRPAPIVAERAAELVPRAKLRALLGDMVRLEPLAEATSGAATLLDEVRKFHAAGLRGEYYESFDVNSKNFMRKSECTEAFIAEFDRLLRKCVRAAERSPRAQVREAFELLFGLLRHIDECHDDVIFFADEGGAWEVGVDWRTALAAYFRCLAEAALAKEFAREVDRAISDFADHERPRHMAAARRAGSAEQKAALRRLAANRRQS